jgi:mutator protein MutT
MVRVTAAVIERDGKILITRRKKGGPFGQLWEFPGGKVEPGESCEECLKRELREELGIEARVGPYLCSSKHDYGHLKVELLAYRIENYSGTMRLTDHDEARWVTPEELHRFEFPEADRPILEKLQEEGRGQRGLIR